MLLEISFLFDQDSFILGHLEGFLLPELVPVLRSRPRHRILCRSFFASIGLAEMHEGLRTPSGFRIDRKSKSSIANATLLAAYSFRRFCHGFGK